MCTYTKLFHESLDRKAVSFITSTLLNNLKKILLQSEYHYYGNFKNKINNIIYSKLTLKG